MKSKKKIFPYLLFALSITIGIVYVLVLNKIQGSEVKDVRSNSAIKVEVESENEKLKYLDTNEGIMVIANKDEMGTYDVVYSIDQYPNPTTKTKLIELPAGLGGVQKSVDVKHSKGQKFYIISHNWSEIAIIQQDGKQIVQSLGRDVLGGGYYLTYIPDSEDSEYVSFSVSGPVTGTVGTVTIDPSNTRIIKKDFTE